MNRLCFVAMAVLLIAVATARVAAEREWQSGTWLGTKDLSIETETYRLVLEEMASGDPQPLTLAAGSAVKFAVETDKVYVLDRGGLEHEMRLVRRVDLTYSAMGGGHYVKAVGGGGQTVTLEDGSFWEIDPRAQFHTARWQPLEGISVRRADPDNGFTYEIDNTDQDNGALARYSPP